MNDSPSLVIVMKSPVSHCICPHITSRDWEVRLIRSEGVPSLYEMTSDILSKKSAQHIYAPLSLAYKDCLDENLKVRNLSEIG